MSTAYTDRYGLPLSTPASEAAEHYIAGIDCALALHMGTQARLEAAIVADAGFAMAQRIGIPVRPGPVGQRELEDAMSP